MIERSNYFPSPYSGNIPNISDIIWREKYKYEEKDKTPLDTVKRFISGVLGLSTHKDHDEIYRMSSAGVLLPGGRIIAGAGTTSNVTMMNCYVQGQVPDSMNGIMEALRDVAVTMSLGGGVGTSFSTIRPKGAVVVKKRTHSSGILPFMHMWDSMSRTIRSAGERRGAMMATLADDHPDILDFITEKHKADSLTQFNISVLISDKFMEAAKNDEDWELGFWVPPKGGPVKVLKRMIKHQVVAEEYSKLTGQLADWYVYKIIKARELWDLIMDSTYKYAEPGVIYIDRMNHLNPLSRLEYLDCSNPCGEQILPPFGACNLGAISLSYCVKHPFTSDAVLDKELVHRASKYMTRYLDKVLDCTKYPLVAQADESRLKRRIGIGITGLADTFLALGIKYGSEDSLDLADEIMKIIAKASYEESIELATEFGPARLLETHDNRVKYVESEFVRTRMPEFVESILHHGIRNTLHCTIAPTGTTSIFNGNVSSGLEPIFDYCYDRKVIREDSSTSTERVWDHAVKYFLDKENWSNYDKNSRPIGLPEYFVTTEDLTVKSHVRMQAACQYWVDSSISKTINCPELMEFGEFQEVYQLAYDTGCKGCTTYRPSPEQREVRGSVLEKVADENPVNITHKYDRPDVLRGCTIKIKWKGTGYYITLNFEEENRLKEVFISSKSNEAEDWIKVCCRSISALARQGKDVRFILQEMQEISSSTQGDFFEGRYYSSLASLIGFVIERYLYKDEKKEISTETSDVTKFDRYAKCPSCNQFSMIKKEGCDSCLYCGFSKCG